MGLLYKGFQSLSYYGLEKAREKGIEVDKERQKNLYAKRRKEFDDNVGINYAYLNKVWHDTLYGDDDN